MVVTWWIVAFFVQCIWQGTQQQSLHNRVSDLILPCRESKKSEKVRFVEFTEV